jgi:F0F1-type ATP synthase alpha subunit
MDSIPVDRVGAYEKELLETFHATQSHILNTIKSTGKLDSVEEQLTQALTDFTQMFNPEEN